MKGTRYWDLIQDGLDDIKTRISYYFIKKNQVFCWVKIERYEGENLFGSPFHFLYKENLGRGNWNQAATWSYGENRSSPVVSHELSIHSFKWVILVLRIYFTYMSIGIFNFFSFVPVQHLHIKWNGGNNLCVLFSSHQISFSTLLFQFTSKTTHQC